MDEFVVFAEAHASLLTLTVQTCQANPQPDNLPVRLSLIDKLLLTIENASSSENPAGTICDRISRIDIQQIAASFKNDDWQWLFMKPEEERREQSIRLVNAARDFVGTRHDDLESLTFLSSLLLRFSLIGSGSLDNLILQFLLTNVLSSAPSAVLSAFHETLPVLITLVADDNLLGRFASVVIRFVSHHAYCNEAATILLRHLPQLMIFWSASVIHKATLMQILSALSINNSLSHVFPSQPAVNSFIAIPSTASVLLDSVIDNSTGLIKSISNCDDIALRNLLESLRLIGRVSSQSAPIADQFATTLFDHELFIGELIRTLRSEVTRAPGPGIESTRRVLFSCRQLEALAGVILAMSLTPKSLSKARSRIERQVIESAASHWDLFVGPFSRIMLALDRYRNDEERCQIAWTGRLSLTDIVKRIPRLITRLQFDDDSLISHSEYETCIDLVSMIKLVTLYAKTTPDPSYLGPDQVHRVYHVLIKRLFEIISAVPCQPVRSAALQALKEIKLPDDQGLLITEMLSSFNTVIRHHKMEMALHMVYVTFQAMVTSDDQLQINYHEVAEALLNFTEMSDHTSILSDPILDDKINQNRVLASCVKVFMLAWRNIAFAKAVTVIPIPTVRKILCRTLALEFLSYIEQSQRVSAKKDEDGFWLPIGGSQDSVFNNSILIEQTLLGFNCNTLLGVVDELSDIVRKIETTDGEQPERTSNEGLRSRLQFLIVRCVQQIADVISGDRKDDVLQKLIGAKTFDEWVSLPSGRPVPACIERETQPLSNFERRQYYLTKPTSDHIDGIAALLNQCGSSEGECDVATKWRDICHNEKKSNHDSFIMVHKATNSVVGFCGFSGPKIESFIIDSSCHYQDQYDIQLCLLSYYDRWSGLNGHEKLFIDLSQHSSQAAFMTRHDHIFRIQQIDENSVKFYWNVLLEYPLEERIDHDLSTIQGQIRHLLTKRILSDSSEEPLLSPLSRVYNLIAGFIPIPSKSSNPDSGPHSFRSSLESYSRQMYERVMRSHASNDAVQPLQEFTSEPAQINDFMQSLKLAFIKESVTSSTSSVWEEKDKWNPVAIGSFEENLIGFTTQSIQQRLFCDLTDATDSSARSSSILSPTALIKCGDARHQFATDAHQLSENDCVIDPSTVVLAAFARILYICVTDGTEYSKRKAQKYLLKRTMLSSLQHWIIVKEFGTTRGPIDIRLLLGRTAINRFGIGAKILATLSRTLNWSAWGLEAFVESCEELNELLCFAFNVSSRLTMAVQSRRDSNRKLPTCMESMMLYLTQMVKDILLTIPLLHYIDRLVDPANPNSTSIDDTPPDVLCQFNLQLQLHVTNLLFGNRRVLKYIQHFIYYDQELSAQTFVSKTEGDDYFDDYEEGSGTTLDRLRINIFNILGILMQASSDIRNVVLYQYSLAGIKYDISVRPSFLQSILTQASIESFSLSLHQSLLHRRIFAVDESIEYITVIETNTKSFLGSSTIRNKLLIMSCHYVYVSNFDLPSGIITNNDYKLDVTNFCRIHYSAVYEVRVDITGQILTLGHTTSPTSRSPLRYEVWAVRLFGSVQAIANLFQRKCGLFTTLYWVPIKLLPLENRKQYPFKTATNTSCHSVEPGCSDIVQLPKIKLATLVDILKPNGLLERKVLFWTEMKQNNKPKHILYIAADVSDIMQLAKRPPQADTNAENWKWPVSSWFNSSSTYSYLLSDLQAVEVTETTKAIMTMSFVGDRMVSIFFACDSARETWKRALRKYLVNSSKKNPWDILMIPSREVI